MICKIKYFWDKYISVLDIIACLFLGLTFSASKSYIETGDCEINFLLLVKTIVLSIIFFVIAILLRVLIFKILNKPIKLQKLNNKLEKLYSSKYCIVILGIIILVCWLPILISMFPGTLINDTWTQLSEYHYKNLSDHHPFFDTLIMGNIISRIESFSNWHVGFFVFVILQAIATSFTFSYTISYAKKKLNISNRILFILFLIYCLIPIFPMAVQTISKDAIFSWIYVLFIVNFIEIVRTNRRMFKFKKVIIYISDISFLYVNKKSWWLCSYWFIYNIVVIKFKKVEKIRNNNFIKFIVYVYYTT